MKKKSVSVTLEHVTKIFKDSKGRDAVVAVDDSHFVIEPGQLITLLGPSGCGKTTTLRMIAGFELPSKGKILIGNDDVTMLPPNKRDTATMFQSYGLFPHMSVFDNVAYGLKLRKVTVDEIKERVDATLELVGLAGFGQRSPSKLSGGQQQRVALARSLIVEPGVLLLDEPLSNLDALLREQMRIEIKRIQRQLGITAVYVTHDRVEAMSLSDQVIVMKDGKIMQVGTPADIYERPDTIFVAGFVGKAAFFEVDVEEKTSNYIQVRLNSKSIKIESFAPNIKDKAVIMVRPESLRLEDENQGFIEGKVKLNVYLGSSMESFIQTKEGEILVQIDDPKSKKLYKEGDGVSIAFDPKSIRLLPTDII